MIRKFIKCANPNKAHIKYLYGSLEDHWQSFKCECGYEFLEVIDSYAELDDNFKDVDAESDTKVIKIL